MCAAMADSCCENKSSELQQLRLKQKNVLVAVLFINAIMFIVEFSAGWISASSALMADSLDMFGDAMVYGFSLYVLYRSELWRARAGLMKGIIMAAFGLLVLAQAGYRLTEGIVPVAETMGVVGLLALAANLICLFLLFRHRSDDINMKSTWICSRNDIVANVGVLMASALVAYTQSIWPDTLFAVVIATLFLRSSIGVVRESLAIARENSAIS